jgi:hypothetical protein
MKGIKNEEGSVLIIALLMLVLLTVAGISASTTSEIEVRIAGNENTYKQNLFYAESAAMLGAQMLEDESAATLKYLLVDWLHASLPDQDLGSTTNWDPGNSNSNQGLDPSNRYLAVDGGIADGSSLDIGGNTTLLRQFSIYGRSTRRNGQGLVELGYRKRF